MRYGCICERKDYRLGIAILMTKQYSQGKIYFPIYKTEKVSTWKQIYLAQHNFFSVYTSSFKSNFINFTLFIYLFASCGEALLIFINLVF